MIRGVFFDCDGVLIDSERVHQKYNALFVEEYHLGFDPMAFTEAVGISAPQMEKEFWPKIYAQARTDWTYEEFRARFDAFKAQRMGPMPFGEILFPDVVETLEGLRRRGVKIACASSSSGPYLHNMVEQCRLEEYFDRLVTGYDFERSKPAPDIYLFCAKAFGLEPEECLVVEDSPYGIAAGRSAVMEVLARRDTFFGMDQSAATEIIDDLREILDYIDGKK